MNLDSKPAAGAFVTESGRVIAFPPSLPPVNEPAAPAKKRVAVAAKPKRALPSKTRKVGRPARSSRAASKREKVVCRYCGSDDLAPSFKKRRDARCRACFKKRYGSTARGKRLTRIRKEKAAK